MKYVDTYLYGFCAGGGFISVIALVRFVFKMQIFS